MEKTHHYAWAKMPDPSSNNKFDLTYTVEELQNRWYYDENRNRIEDNLGTEDKLEGQGKKYITLYDYIIKGLRGNNPIII